MSVITYIVGIDEVGRGPLAGPVVLCACAVPVDFDFSLLADIRDSKKLSEKKREEWHTALIELGRTQGLNYALASVEADEIDTIGIARAIEKAVGQCLDTLKLPPDVVEVRLDGSLKAPKQFIHQRTIIKGDEKEPIISAASILAKVMRDRYMVDISSQYPEYGFGQHKGYGTATHIRAIRSHGPSPLHRRTFLSSILTSHT